MIFKVYDNYIHNGRDTIMYNTLELIAGKKIDLSKRLNKDIYIVRENSYIKIYDMFFIENEYYKKDNIIYKCEYINNNNAMLKPLNNTIKAILCDNSIGWEIVNESTAISYSKKKQRNSRRKTSYIKKRNR